MQLEFRRYVLIRQANNFLAQHRLFSERIVTRTENIVHRILVTFLQNVADTLARIREIRTKRRHVFAFEAVQRFVCYQFMCGVWLKHLLAMPLAGVWIDINHQFIFLVERALRLLLDLVDNVLKLGLQSHRVVHDRILHRLCDR